MNKYLMISGLLACLLIWPHSLRAAFPGSVAEKNFLPFENIYVHTDKDIYFAGDQLFYKVYLQTSPGQDGDIHSSVFYLGLADIRGHFVARHELYSKSVTASGVIQVPDTLQTGIYSLAGWTNNMLIDRSSVFSRQVLIINRFDEDFENFVSGQRFFALEPDSVPEVKTIAFDSWKHPSTVFSTAKTNFRTREMVTLQPVRSGLHEKIASASLTITRAETLLLNAPGALPYDQPENQMVSGDSSPQIMVNLQQGLFPLDAFPPKNQAITITQPDYLIIPEGNGPIINGKVLKKDTNTPVSEAIVFLSALDTLVNLQYGVSQPDGAFYFLLNEYYQGKEIYLSVFNGAENNHDVEIRLREKFVPRPFVTPKLITHPQVLNYLEEARVFKRIQRTIPPENYGRFSAPALSIEANFPPPLIYSNPTHQIRTRDYLALDDFFEIGNEIVPNLRLRRRGDRVMASIVNPNNRSLLSDEPAFFFNGVFVQKVNDLIDLSSEQIALVEVLSIPWLFGDIQFNGIVGVFSGEMQVPLPNRAGYTIIQGNAIQRQLTAMAAETAGEGIRPASLPDFRETLLWWPEIELIDGAPSEVTFLTSDLKGTYAVVLEGLTVSGQPFSQKFFISVN